MHRFFLFLVAMGVMLAAPASAASYPAMVEFGVTCGTSATAIDQGAADGRVWDEVMCWNLSATIVYIGSTTVTTTSGAPVCTTAATCLDIGAGSIRVPVRRGGVGCIVAVGTVAIRCQAPVASKVP